MILIGCRHHPRMAKNSGEDDLSLTKAYYLAVLILPMNLDHDKMFSFGNDVFFGNNTSKCKS